MMSRRDEYFQQTHTERKKCEPQVTELKIQAYWRRLNLFSTQLVPPEANRVKPSTCLHPNSYFCVRFYQDVIRARRICLTRTPECAISGHFSAPHTPYRIYTPNIRQYAEPRRFAQRANYGSLAKYFQLAKAYLFYLFELSCQSSYSHYHTYARSPFSFSANVAIHH